MTRRLLRLQLALGATVFVGAVFGCAGLTALVENEQYPKVQPAHEDLVGTYRPTKETLALVAQGGYAEREMAIELNAGGAFVLNNIPDWWRSWDEKPAGGFDSGFGKWQVAKNGSSWELELHFPTLRHFTPPMPEASLIKGVALIGQTAPYEIALFIGDRDCGRAMRFRKQPPAP